MVNGVQINTLIVTEVLVGSLSYRHIDNIYSIQYDDLIRKKLIPVKEKIGYE